jgi:hypothetical protein
MRGWPCWLGNGRKRPFANWVFRMHAWFFIMTQIRCSLATPGRLNCFWRTACGLSYALREAKDSPEMASFHSRFKHEDRSLFVDAQAFAELTTVVDERMHYHSTQRRHSALGCPPPLTYIKRARLGLGTQL